MGKKGKKGKGGKGGKKGKKRGPNDGPTVTEIALRRLLKLYDAYSASMGAKCCPEVTKAVKLCLEEETELMRLVIMPINKDLKLEDKFKKALKEAEDENDRARIAELKASYSNTPPPVYVEALMRSLNDVQLQSCRELYVFDVPMFYTDMVETTYFLKIQPLIQKIEFSDCCLDYESVKRFSGFLNKRFLTSISLDYNEFGDKGCYELCKGLVDNKSLLSLSLNYCVLTSKSGEYLGEILSTTALRELFLDGNDLRCEGVMSLINRIVEVCESEAMRIEAEEKIKEEEEARRLAEEAAKPAWEKDEQNDEGVGATTDAEAKTDAENTDNEKGKEEKKKKKKKKKKKSKDDPPPVGPFVYKLHLADNGIDIYEDGANHQNSLQILHKTITSISKLIKYSKDLEELDLHNNTIGNMSARMILNALEYRKLKKVGKLGVRVSEKIDKEMFDAIMKLSKSVKKKKGKKKKKKVFIQNKL